MGVGTVTMMIPALAIAILRSCPAARIVVVFLVAFALVSAFAPTPATPHHVR